MKNTVNTLFALLLSSLLGSVVANAQKASSSKQQFNRFGVGLQLSHMYDLRFKGYDDLQNGFSGEDMVGLNGEKTQFDLAYGLDLSYQLSPVLAVDMYGMMGTMSGANQIEYYRSSFRSVGVGANVSLKTAKTKLHRFVPYVRFATGWSGYDATRYFILDDVDFSTASGNALHYNLGLGVNAHLSNKWSVNVQSVFNVVSSDAWDGYNYGSGRDHMIQTSVGLRYTLGSKKRTHLNRSAAWQGVTNKDVLDTQEKLLKGMKTLDDMVTNLGTKQEQYQQKTDAMLSELQSDMHPDSLIALIDSRIKRYQEALKAGELHAIYFDFNKAVINSAGQTAVQEVAQLLKSNPSWKVTVSAYSDAVGNESANEAIRDQRRLAAKQALLDLGIPEARIAFAAWEGIYTGNNQIDRRVELRLVK